MTGDRLNKTYSSLEDCPRKYEGALPTRFVDISGEIYNYLKVLYLIGFKNGRSEWICKCLNCGQYVSVNSHNLRSGHTKSCGCLVSKSLREDLTGQDFGFLHVIEYDKSINENPYWKVQCTNCGKIYSVCGDALKKQKSCGCIKSWPEIKIYDTLKQKYPILQKEYAFPDCVFKNKLKFDFYKADELQDLLIEYDGQQHYRPIIFGNMTEEDSYKNFISCQVKDWYKDNYCITHNIPLIRIKYCNIKNPSFNDIYNNAYIVGKNQGSDKHIDIFNIIDTDFINNKRATFNISAGISCTFKCCKDDPHICQNSPLCKQAVIHYDIDKLIKRYNEQDISKCITIQGLEPLDNLKQVLWFIYYFRKQCDDEIYLWTGYTEEECDDLIYLINEKMQWKNIIIKFGRFIPNQDTHYDDVLGVMLASPNQYARRIS